MAYVDGYAEYFEGLYTIGVQATLTRTANTASRSRFRESCRSESACAEFADENAAFSVSGVFVIDRGRLFRLHF